MLRKSMINHDSNAGLAWELDFKRDERKLLRVHNGILVEVREIECDLFYEEHREMFDKIMGENNGK